MTYSRFHSSTTHILPKHLQHQLQYKNQKHCHRIMTMVHLKFQHHLGRLVTWPHPQLHNVNTSFTTSPNMKRSQWFNEGIGETFTKTSRSSLTSNWLENFIPKIEFLCFVISRMGYPGRDCILQALCESPKIFNMKKRTMVQELIKTVFTFPKSKVLPFEHAELLIYDEAHRKGRSGSVDCGSISRCGFSLIKMALGSYSKEAISFM